MLDKEWLGPLVAMLCAVAVVGAWVWFLSPHVPQRGTSWGMALFWTAAYVVPAGALGGSVFALVWKHMERIRGNRWYRKHYPDDRARKVRQNRGS